VNKYRKVAFDMSTVLFGWSIWYLAIVLIVNIVQIVIHHIHGESAESYMSSIYFSGNIYMFVIGIIVAKAFLEYFVHNGVTRKDFFKGNAITGVVLSLLIVGIGAIVASIQYFIANVADFSIQFRFDTSAPEAVSDTNVIGEVLKVIVDPRLYGTENMAVLTLFAILSMIFYFLNGWMIALGFYKYNSVGSFYILLALFFFLIKGLIWGGTFSGFSLELIFGNVPIILMLTLLLIGVLLWIIFQMIRRVPIKI